MSGVLEFATATVGYDAPVVREASLRVEAGEVVGIIGPNGAGKTTLLRAVTGGARIVGGDILVGGRPVRTYSRLELARSVAVLPQSAPQPFAFTARRFVEMGRHARVSRFGGLRPADVAAVERAMALTDTAGLAGEPVDTLSGGDLQRLTLAQALAQEPALLLLDEPTSHLDLNHRLQVLDVVRALADGADGAAPLAVVAVFHDLDMAARYADRLAVVSDARLMEADSPERVLTASMLADVFGVRAVIGTDPVTGAVQVLPVVRAEERAASRGVSTLVISGSGTGAAVMRRLAVAGFDVRAGALARGDTDEQVATSLDAPFVPLAPFGSMGPEEESAVRHAASQADVVVVVATPFGPANLANLRALSRSGARVVLVGRLALEDDFAHGEAMRLWTALEKDGAVLCEGSRCVVECVEKAVAGVSDSASAEHASHAADEAGTSPATSGRGE
jgi:iron complex transport system ATP-binding protein